MFYARFVLSLLVLLVPAVEAQSLASLIPDPESKHLFGIVPNYLTASGGGEIEPLSARTKFKMATEDTFDPGTLALAVIFAGQNQVSDADRSFGQGTIGFAHYYGCAFADLAIGNYLTEGVLPVLLHQDPRYFRRSSGTGWSRMGYALRQIVWTRTDRGGSQFNYSEVLGSAGAVGISNLYYPDHRQLSSMLGAFGAQVGADAFTNVLKEFWPEIHRRIERLRPAGQ